MEPCSSLDSSLPGVSSSNHRNMSRGFVSQVSRRISGEVYRQLGEDLCSPSAADLGRQLTQQLTEIMNNRNIPIEPKDESPRGEEHSPLVYYFGARLLRGGLLTQCLALGMQILIFLIFGGHGWFNGNLFAAPHSLKNTQVYVHLNTFLEVAFLLGVIQVAAFQVLIADSSKWTLGFRSGSKLLASAASFDLSAAALRVASCLHFCRFISARWLGRNVQLSGEWSFSYLGGTLQGLSLLSYGAAFAALELYHDKGTESNYAWAMLALFPLAGIAKLCSIYLSLTSLSPLLLLLALSVAYRWAVNFEPLLEKWSPELHSRRLDDNILPNPRDTQQQGNRPLLQQGTESDTYVYASIPTGAPETETQQPHRMYTTATSSNFAAMQTSQGIYSNLPTSYDYDTLQRQVQSHAQQQQQQEQQQEQQG